MNINLADPILYRDIIVLYCPKKVGSTSLVSSIRLSASDKYAVYHTHDETIFKSNPDANLKSFTIHDVIKNSGIYYNITNHKRKVYFIDIYRNPIERKISEFFEDISIHFNNTEENIVNYSIEKIIKRFNDIFEYLPNIDYYFTKYPFSKQIPNSFDFESKFLISHHDHITFIKLRLNDVNSWAEILSNILNTEIIIHKDYETSNKKIGSLYNKFKSEYKLPYNFYKIIEDSPEVKFYLSIEERNKYLNYWKNKTIGFYTPYSKSFYEFYKTICEENKFYTPDLSNHYFDDGCLCEDCVNKRNNFISNIKNNLSNSQIKKIVHDSNNLKQNSKIFVKSFNQDGSVSDILQNLY
jgi:hypothetical protein